MSQTYSVTISVGLIEKLAGMQKAETPKSAPPSLRPWPVRNLENESATANDAALAKALQSSHKVGALLLKQEAAELEKVEALASSMLSKYSYPSKPVPCEVERAACIDCYKQNKDPLNCAAAVSNYSKCSEAAFSQYVSSVKATAQ